MKQLLGILIATLMIGTSQANGNESITKLTAIAARPQIVTQRDPVRVKKTIKSKVVNLKVKRFLDIDDDDSIFLQEEDLATGYRRRDLSKIEHPDGISEKVRWRLFLARQLAIMKYREIHG
jgi:hypothetical protein